MSLRGNPLGVTLIMFHVIIFNCDLTGGWDPVGRQPRKVWAKGIGRNNCTWWGPGLWKCYVSTPSILTWWIIWNQQRRKVGTLLSLIISMSILLYSSDSMLRLYLQCTNYNIDNSCQHLLHYVPAWFVQYPNLTRSTDFPLSDRQVEDGPTEGVSW